MSNGEFDALQQSFRTFLRDMTPEQRRGIAERFDVTERTVQRWAKEPGTGQTRNFMPKKLRDVPVKDWERPLQRRSNTAKMADTGLSQKVLSGDGRKLYVERFKGPNAALEYVKSLRQNIGDRFLGSHYTSVEVVRVGDEFEVRVEYSPVYRIGFADERGAVGGSFLDDDLFGGVLDNDLF